MSNAKKSLTHNYPPQFGATFMHGGAHFTLFAPEKKHVSLALICPKQKVPDRIINLCHDIHLDKKGIWRIFVDEVTPGMFYGYFIDEQWVVDPYAYSLSTSSAWGGERERIHGVLVASPPFSWDGIERPNYSIEELFIYEMHVRGYTADPSSGAKHPGTFKGVVEKISHLKDLGVNAVELMPVFSFDERSSPETGLCNYWGYSPESFFALMAPYGTRREFQEMVKALHRAKIEIILDVVYNHVGSSWLSQLAKQAYFINHEGNHTNFTGCGNTISTNQPVTMELILDSLRYFAKEMHIDGFRFDLASIFCRAENGAPIEDPPIIRAMTTDPILSSVKLIAEPWDCGGIYQVGSFPAKHRFAQWNGQFRDHVRRFLKGTDGAAGLFASAMAGSSNFHSINFITAHDGFTLRDLVSYNEKHNKANGEQGRDGSTCNESWNCGVEGPTDDTKIVNLRTRQIKNFILALCFSQGTPMMQMSDEYGHTRSGNNNAYCQDNALSYFLWKELEKSQSIFRFYKQCISLRKKCVILNKKGSLSGSEVDWHEPNWSVESRFVAYVIRDRDQDFFLAFNTSDNRHKMSLPLSRSNSPWNRVIDTAIETPDEAPVENTYILSPRSSVLILS